MRQQVNLLPRKSSRRAYNPYIAAIIIVSFIIIILLGISYFYLHQQTLKLDMILSYYEQEKEELQKSIITLEEDDTNMRVTSIDYLKEQIYPISPLLMYVTNESLPKYSEMKDLSLQEKQIHFSIQVTDINHISQLLSHYNNLPWVSSVEMNQIKREENDLLYTEGYVTQFIIELNDDYLRGEMSDE